MIKTMLVPLDGSALSERALPFAARLAAASGARLVLVHGRSPVVIRKEPAFDADAFARAMREAQAVGAARSTGRIEINARVCDVYVDKVAEGIWETAREEHADLIVMSTHGRGGLGRALYGSVADQVLRLATVPVLLISAACEHAWADSLALRILLPLDGSTFAEDAVRPAIELADALRAEVLVLRAVEPTDYAYAEGAPFTGGALEAELKAAREYVDGVAAKLRFTGRSVSARTEAGSPAATIARVAHRERADLVAMATHGRSGLARLTLGSVATGTLQRVHVPLMLVRPVAMRHEAAGPEEPEAASRRGD